MYSIFMNEATFISSPRFHGSLLPLQVGSIGFWVNVFLQVVAEVHQHLVVNQAASTKERIQKIKLVKYIQSMLILSHTYSF